MISEAGIYAGVTEQEYLTDAALAPELGRSLSGSGARALLRATPAHFAYQREHGRKPKDFYDLGTLAHRLVLRSDDRRIRVIDAYDWMARKDQAAKKAAYAKGLIPVHRGQLREAALMAASVRRHRTARLVLANGRPEMTAYWIDPETQVTCRARFDWLAEKAIVEFKTTKDASPTGFAKDAANYGYAHKAEWYQTAYEAITGKRLPFIFVVVETEPPYLPATYQMPSEWLTYAAEENARGRALYAELESAGEWPGYSDDIEWLEPPYWALR